MAPSQIYSDSVRDHLHITRTLNNPGILYEIIGFKDQLYFASSRLFWFDDDIITSCSQFRRSYLEVDREDL